MMEEQHEERDARLKALEKEAEQTRERTKELRKQYHIRETELKQLAGQTSERKSELVTLKADKQRKREELEAKHQALFELGEEITHVRQVVSESPAQLEARINDQRKTLEDRLQQQRIAEQQSMNLEKARSAFDQVFEELGLFSRQIQEWAEQIRGEREAQRVLRQLQIDMKAAQSDLEKVAYHGKQLETQIGQTEERIRRHQEQTTKSTQELAQSQEQLTQEHGRKQAEARLNSSHVQAIEETCAELRGELGRIRHQRDQDMRRTLEESDNLQGIIDRYMRLLGAKMGFSGDTLVESPVVSKRHPNGAT
jgi:chromosome segregation ATPase